MQGEGKGGRAAIDADVRARIDGRPCVQLEQLERGARIRRHSQCSREAAQALLWEAERRIEPEEGRGCTSEPEGAQVEGEAGADGRK